MMKLPTLAGLEGLLDLDRQGVDIRPTLLRVLTDQYLQTPVPSPDDVRQYTELALRLLDETDIATRAAVSARLAPHAAAPRPIVLQLARDVLDVAEPVLLQSPTLTPADLAAIAEERGSSYAEIISRRDEPHAPRALDTADEAELEPEAEAPPINEASDLCELFYAAGPQERRLILMSLDYVPSVPREPPAAMKRADVWRLESEALRHNTEAVVRDLERGLGVSHMQARRIVNDDSGEPIVIAAKAMDLPADVLQRMVLFMNPRVGQSVDRVYELAALYSDMSVDAARRMIAIWRDADPVGRRRGGVDPRAWHNAADNARRVLAEITRPAGQRDTLRVARGSEGR
jgi:hypothetical protein